MTTTTRPAYPYDLRTGVVFGTADSIYADSFTERERADLALKLITIQ